MLGPHFEARDVHPRVQFETANMTMIFLHIPKTGGTTFNQRLTMLRVAPPCTVWRTASAEGIHNGHDVVDPQSVSCLRRGSRYMDRSCVSPLGSARHERTKARTGGGRGGGEERANKSACRMPRVTHVGAFRVMRRPLDKFDRLVPPSPSLQRTPPHPLRLATAISPLGTASSCAPLLVYPQLLSARGRRSRTSG